MRLPGDSQDEMRGLWLDGDTADRLLAGRVDPDDAPPGYAEAARLLRAAGAPPAAGELTGEAGAVAAAAAAVLARPAPLTTPRRSRTMSNGPKARSRFFRTKVASLVVVGTLAATTGLAAAGALPDPVQDAVSSALSRVGISVPSSHPASTGEEISTIATTTDATGVDKGAEISTAASGGISRAGQNGAPDDTGVPQPPDVPGHGAETADEASGGQSAQGTGNTP